MQFDERKEALLSAAKGIQRVLKGEPQTPEEHALAKEVREAYFRNAWFTPHQMRTSLSSLADMLQEEALDRWVDPWKEKAAQVSTPRTVLLIMAGNIPFVGMQDVIAVLLFGHQAMVKPSSREDRSLARLLELVTAQDPRLSDRVRILEEPVKGPDAVIATGSDNSSRYFSWYFGHLPHTFRANRNGVAVLEGDESEEELQKLLDDILLYFGLGCRNVSKLFVPEDWEPEPLMKLLEAQEWLKEHQKYMNNYAYHKAIYLMNGERFYDTGNLLLKEDEGIASPLGVLFYEKYPDREALQKRLKEEAEGIQCIVSRRHVPFGQAQFPALGEHETEKDPLELLARLD